MLRKRAREGMKETMVAKQLKAGLEERKVRDLKLAAKRAARAARAAEKARLEGGCACDALFAAGLHG